MLIARFGLSLKRHLARHLLGELDVVEDDEGTLDVEHCSVVDSRSNIVISGHCLDVVLNT